MARLILDTGVLIAGVRGHADVAAIVDHDDVAIPAIAIAEYLVGTLLDEHAERATAHRGFLDEVLGIVPICEYDHDVAEHHAALLAHVQRTGDKRGAHDLIVAASARATDRTVVTTDKRARFGDLPDVKVQLIRS